MTTEEQKVKDLSVTQNPKATDFIMLITNLTNNVLEKCQLTDIKNLLFGDSISEDEGNALTTGSDNKLYVPEQSSPQPQIDLGQIWGVGELFITTNNVCPLAALIPDSVWELVAEDRVLQGAGTRGSVGDTLDESLPNITGKFGVTDDDTYNVVGDTSGAFYNTNIVKGNTLGAPQVGNSRGQIVGFNASNSSSTYQDNAPVQQDAYLVNIFRRVA